jgi:formate dehydrogenase iron-sulfur subunit
MTLLSSIDPILETPFDTYIAKQTELTAVERFSRAHSEDLEHHQAKHYRDLIPLSSPEPGHQYAFAVDLDACTGCKACVSACHSMNGLDSDELWRTVIVLRSRPSGPAYQQSVTSSCHHCVDPACLKGCPVNAYEKDPITGIVSHLDDQCIGCSYCTLSCPYEVPAFNEQRGIVRKCDMCRGRLAAGEAPACVQGCPNEAISITIVNISSILSATSQPNATVVAGAPPSKITAPTTQYVSLHDAVSKSPAVNEQPAAAHTPLAVMLVLTQMAVGTFVVEQIVRGVSGSSAAGLPRSLDAALAVIVAIVAMGASVFHLGRPRYFYRSVIGLRHSWLSREVVAVGAFTTLATAYGTLSQLRSTVDSWTVDLISVPAETTITIAGLGAAACGVAAVFCSAKIYSVTRRPSWRIDRIGPKFAATAVILGIGALVWATVIHRTVVQAVDGDGVSLRWLTAIAAMLLTAKLGSEVSVLRHRWAGRDGDENGARVAHLLANHLRRVAFVRFGAGTFAAAAFITMAVALDLNRPSIFHLVAATLALTAATLGELYERSLFFTTVGAPQ